MMVQLHYKGPTGKVSRISVVWVAAMTSSIGLFHCADGAGRTDCRLRGWQAILRAAHDGRAIFRPRWSH